MFRNVNTFLADFALGKDGKIGLAPGARTNLSYVSEYYSLVL